MNPYGLERVARQRTDELRAEAARRRAGTARRDHALSIRHRTGWALVQIGLSLISTSPGLAPYPRPRRRGHAPSW
jgi:hypothetical protein